MNDEQRKTALASFEEYNRLSFRDWVSECTCVALGDIRDAKLVPEDKEAREALGVATEELFCRTMIERLQQHLQERRKDYPNKVAFVEIEYEENPLAKLSSPIGRKCDAIIVNHVSIGGERLLLAHKHGVDSWNILEVADERLELRRTKL